MEQTTDTTAKDIDVIIIGDLTVALYAEQIGVNLEDAQTFDKSIGGRAGEIAVGCARQGLQVAILSCIGNDPFGNFLRNRLLREKINVDHLKILEGTYTGLSLFGVRLPRSFSLLDYQDSCAYQQLAKEHVDKNFIKRAKAIVFTGSMLLTKPLQKMAVFLLNLAKKNDCKFIFDINYHPVLWKAAAKGSLEYDVKPDEDATKAYQLLLPQCDMIVGNKGELKIAAGENDIDSALASLINHLNCPIVYKEVEQGCQIHMKSLPKPIRTKAKSRPLLSNAGTDAALVSGLLRGMLDEESLENVANYANACELITMSRQGSISAIPSYDEMIYYLNHEDTQEDVIQSAPLNLLHRRVSTVVDEEEYYYFSIPSRKILYETLIHKNHQAPGPTQFLHQVFTGFELAFEYEAKGQLALMMDGHPNNRLMNKAINNRYRIAMEVGDLAQGVQLVKRPQQWLVIGNYDHNFISDEKLQLEMLQQFFLVCHQLDRKFLINFHLDGDNFLEASQLHDKVKAIYELGIYPYCWNIQSAVGTEMILTITDAIKKYDAEAKVLFEVNEPNIQGYTSAFSVLKNTSLVTGFTFGMKFFLPLWEDLQDKNLMLRDVAMTTAVRIDKLIEMWLES